MRCAILLAAGLALAALPARAQPTTLPAAIYADPPADAAHPPRMEVLHIPSGGVEINGVAYLAGGAGPHPTLVLLHGLPGNEKNLDLAQAVRRAGWNVVTFNYRGSWAAPELSASRAICRTPRRCWPMCAIPSTPGRCRSTPGAW